VVKSVQKSGVRKTRFFRTFEERGPMLESNTTVFGVYADFVALRTSVKSLKALGFRDDDISVLFPERAVLRALPDEPEASFFAATGIEIEPLIGGNLNFLTYIYSVGEGAVSGALSFLGVPAYEAERYEGRIKNGELLVGVRSECTSQAELATEILVETGARNVWAAAADSWGEGVESSSKGRSRTGGRNPQSGKRSSRSVQN
jgi:hypothetical protein